jgi:hypothetical protein
MEAKQRTNSPHILPHADLKGGRTSTNQNIVKLTL